MTPMLRIIFVAMAIACNALISNASTFNGPEKSAWGIKVMGGVEIPGTWHNMDFSTRMFNAGLSTSVTAVRHIHLGSHFYLQPEAGLFYTRYSYKDLEIIDNEIIAYQSDPSLYKLGLVVPVIAGFAAPVNDNLSISIFTGPQLRYAFAGKVVDKVPSVDGEMDGLFDLWGKNGQRRFDFAWKFGAGIPVNDFFFSAEVTFGISNLIKYQNLSYSEDRVVLGVTYFF